MQLLLPSKGQKEGSNSRSSLLLLLPSQRQVGCLPRSKEQKEGNNSLRRLHHNPRQVEKPLLPRAGRQELQQAQRRLQEVQLEGHLLPKAVRQVEEPLPKREEQEENRPGRLLLPEAEEVLAVKAGRWGSREEWFREQMQAGQGPKQAAVQRQRAGIWGHRSREQMQEVGQRQRVAAQGERLRRRRPSPRREEEAEAEEAGDKCHWET